MPARDRRDPRFRLTELQAQHLADAYGTPLYVLDEAHFRRRIRDYRQAFESVWPNCQLSFASKSNSTAAIIAIAAQEGCHIDVASEGELRVAQFAGVDPARCHLHGNNKQAAELAYAFEQGIGVVVIDHLREIDMIAALHPPASTQFVLRLAPGVDPETSAKISTGQADTKFGFNIDDGAAEVALLKAIERGLEVIGFHCHVGSQLTNPDAQRLGGANLARFAVQMLHRHQFTTRYLNLGGGLGVHYTDRDCPADLETYNEIIASAVREALEGTPLNPILGQEPGRSLVAESGVTLYRVGVIKDVPARTYVSVDGGLSDNPRPAMYGSPYTVETFRPGASKTVTVSGRHCETDLLFPDVSLPADLEVGDLLQVLVTGAYSASMASNYNRFQRPASVLVRPDGSEAMIQKRDTWEEMLAREVIPEDLRP